MKNRRNMIVAFLLCACLIVGVGYAALVDELVIDATGTFSESPTDFDQGVKFTNIITKGNGMSATIQDDDLVNLTVNFISGDEASYDAHTDGVYTSTLEVEFTYYTAGDSDLPTSAVFSAPVFAETPETGWDVEMTLVNSAGAHVSNVTLMNNETATVLITVKCNPSADNAQLNTTFKINVPVAENTNTATT